MKKIACLVPAYKPTNEFIVFIEKLVKCDYQTIIVVDDGSGEEYSELFLQAEKIGCTLITHEKNCGKGRALKTGIKYYKDNYTDGIGIVTADADGQHTVGDIEKVALSLMENEDKLIMGCRAFGEEVPFKSKAGNLITRYMYRLASGIKLSDTQTGLRGLPYTSLEKMLLISGERYEFEMSMLMELKSMKLEIVEVPIQTVYFDNNIGSHFNAVKDSILIYGMILSYIGASILSFIVDYGLYTLLLFVLPMVLKNSEQMIFGLPLLIVLSNVGARIVSNAVNFILNRKILMPKTSENDDLGPHIVKYYSLAIFAMIMDTIFVSLLSFIFGKYIAKLISAVVIYVFNFFVQKRYIFV